jgi:hypothetical protein
VGVWAQRPPEPHAVLLKLAFSSGLLVGQTPGDALYAAQNSAQTDPDIPRSASEATQGKARRKWQLYSGLSIELKRKITLPTKHLRQLHD